MGGEWKKMVFSRAFSVNPTTSLKRGDDYPFVEMAALNPGSRCAFATERRIFDGGGSRFQSGDTLMARITPCLENGKIARYCGEMGEVAHGSTEFIVVRGREEISDTNFAYYLTKSERVSGYAISQMTGTSGRQRVPTTALDHLLVALPTLPEQRAIAHVLGTLDDKIELNRRMNETLEGMARALFKSWFVDFDPVRAKAAGRDPGLPKGIAALFPDSFQDSELGEIPMGWRPSRLGREVVAVLGGTPSRAESAYWGGDIPWINSGKANEFRVIEPSEFITKEGLSSSATKLLPARTTVIAITGATLGQISLTEIETCANQSIVGVLGTPRLPSEFIYFWTKEHVEGLVSRQTGGAQQHINKNNVNDLPVLCPSESVMASYFDLARPTFDRIKGCCNESQTLAALRDTLLPKLITGELKVKEVKNTSGGRLCVK